MPRKTTDPRLIALLDKREKLRADCERHYSRMRRAFNRLEKSRRALTRLAKRIDALQNAQNVA
jgi:hypothetical protein